LSNALTGGTGPGKLNAVSAPANTAHNTTQQADSFSKAAQAVNVTVSSSPITANQPQAPTGSSGFGNKPQDLTGYNYNYKGYNNYQQYQYPNSNNYSSSAQQTGSSQYKAGAGGGQYDKYESSAQLQNNPTAVLGLASTSTTNALSGKVSATTASKVNMPNLPPGVASMLHHPQYMATGLAPAAFYGLQQPMYGAYGNTGFEDLAAIQRATASAAGLHTLPTTGFYDPNNQFAAATSLGTAVAANNRNDGNTNLNSLTGVSTTSSTGSAIGSSSASSGFGSTSTSTVANDSTSSPGPNAITTTASGSQHHVQQQQQHPQTQQQQQQQQQQQNAFNLAATNALAAQQMPPGYAYFYGNMAGTIPAAYGAAAATPSHVYQPTAMTVPGAGATATSQFQKGYGTNNYGSGYDTLGQQGNKDFTNSYSSNGQSKSTGGSAGAGSGHQYWGNTLTSAPLW